MPSITFTDGVTVVPASWLNDVNNAVYFPSPTAAQTVTLAGDLTGTGLTGTSINTTLNTVNSNVGTFGTSTKVPQITTNAKGLITGVTELTLTSSTIGLGGQTISGDTTLTVNSSANIIVSSSTSAGKYITLPDATTCLQGISLFTISNNSKFDFGIKDSTGTKLGWIRSGITAMVGLNDKSTAAGVWSTLNVEKIGVTAETNVAQQYRKSVQLDANRVLFYTDGTTSVYGVIYDYSTGLFGAETLIRAIVTSGSVTAIKNATNQVLFVAADLSNHIAIICTCSGTTITPDTAVTSAFTNAPSQFNDFGIALIGTNVWYSYGEVTGTTQFIRGITVSGTVPTFGSPVTLGTANIKPIRLYVSGSILRVVWPITGSGGIQVSPYTITGATAALGSPGAFTPGAFAGDNWISYVNGNGNIVIFLLHSTSCTGVLSVLGGTTETVTSVLFKTGFTGSSINTELNVFPIGTNQAAVAQASTGSAGVCTLYTDTAGTLSKSTNSASLFAAGTTAISNVGTQLKFVSAPSSGLINVYSINFSVSPPSLTSTTRYYLNAIGGISPPTISSIYLVTKPSNLLINSTSEYLIDSSYGAQIASYFTPANSLSINAPLASSQLNILGLTNNEGWVGGATNTRLQRVEVAA